jgi:hypothetical protein
MRWWIAILAALVALPAWADTVVLQDGRKLTGDVIKDDATGVHLKVKGITVTFRREEVTSVTRGEAAASSPDDPVARRFARTGVAEVDRSRERSHDLLQALEKAAAEAREDGGDAGGLRQQLVACEKRIESSQGERDRLKERYDKARADYDEAAAKCGSGG